MTITELNEVVVPFNVSSHRFLAPGHRRDTRRATGIERSLIGTEIFTYYLPALSAFDAEAAGDS